MKPVKKDPAIKEYIREIIRLDLGSIQKQIYGSNANGSINRPVGKVASVATIRTLLVVFKNLYTQLVGIQRITQIEPYYDYRKALIDRVLPAALFAFEYCRQTLSWKGATESAIATKLANLANGTCDCLEDIRTRVNIALEYYELKNNVIAGIREYSLREDFSKSDASPLMFSLTVSLPLRLEAFASNASKHFPESVEYLNKLSEDITNHSKKRIAEIEDIEAHKKNDEIRKSELERASRMPRKEASPIRPKIHVLRGVRYRQPLHVIHQRIPSLKEIELQKLSLSDNDKENLNANVGASVGGSSSKPSSPKTDCRRTSPLSRGSMRSTFRNPTATSSLPVSNSLHSKKINTRVKPPTRVENRKLVQPNMTRPPELKEKISTLSLNSKISRPTMIQPRRSSTQLRPPIDTSTPFLHTPRSRTFSGSSASDASDSSIDSTVDSKISHSQFQLSSPEPIMEETPLTRKGGHGTSGLNLLHPRGSAGNLFIPRTRKSGTMCS